MRVLDLFSGIGGFSLGLDRAGMETVAFCEMDSFCQKVLAKHWPDIPIHNNIEDLDGRQYKGTVELVCGGFPCQPFSVAGKQRGSEDDRALWPEMLRVIREVEPAWVIGENVSGIINLELDNVLSSLEDSGYSCQTFVVPACAVDAKHRRDRVWIIASHAHFNSKSDGSQYEGQRSGELAVADTRSQGVHKRRGSSSSSEESGDKGRVRQDGLSSRDGEEEQTVADTLSEGLEGYPWDVPRGDKSRRLNKIEGRPTAETGLPAGKPRRWLPEPGMGGVADGVSRWMDEPEEVPRVIGKVPDRTHRLKALGNAVVPQVVEVIGRMVMEMEAEKSNP